MKNRGDYGKEDERPCLSKVPSIYKVLYRGSWELTSGLGQVQRSGECEEIQI